MNKTNQTGIPALFIAILSLAGLVISYILEIRHAGSSFAEGICGINSNFDCNAVTSSEYAKVFGISLSQYGLFYYIFISFLSVKIFLSPNKTIGFKKIILTLTLFSSIFSIYLFGVSKFILNALCPFCIGLYIVNILSFLIAIKTYKFTNIISEIKKSFGYFLLITFVVSIALSLFISDIISQNHSQSDTDFKKEESSWIRSGSLKKFIRENEGLLNDYTLGKKDAPIEIVKFSDLQCPYCKRMSYSIDDITSKYPNKVKFVMKNYPLDSTCNKNMQGKMHQSACFAAESLRCVGEQGEFFNFLKDLYNLDALSNPNYSPVSVRAAIKARVKLNGYDVEAFNECMKSGRQLEAIQKDIANATKLNISGTPSIYINGKLVEKPNDEKLKNIIESLIEEK